MGDTKTWSLKISTEENTYTTSGNAGLSTDESEYSLRDMNGDGLPDRMDKSGKVYLNLGYKYASAHDAWTISGISDGTSINYGKSDGVGGSGEIFQKLQMELQANNII